MLSHYLKDHIGQFWNDVISEQPLTHTVGDTGTVDTAADLFAMQNYFVEEGHFQDYFTLGRIDKYV